MNHNADLLFDYLKNAIYNPANAVLDVASLEDDFVQLGKGLVFFCQCMLETNRFAGEIARGNLLTPPPSSDNEFASPLKSLQAALRHLTWQTQQVASGDYQQRVDFLGDFAEAFNIMVVQLDQRQKALEQEIEEGRQKTQALTQSNALLMSLAQNIPQCMLVFHPATRKVLFTNVPMERELGRDAAFLPSLFDEVEPMLAGEIAGAACRTEYGCGPEEERRYFRLSISPLRWGETDACALIMDDVTRERETLARLEKYAYIDALTKVKNRHAGMEMLEDLTTKHRPFCLCFVDLNRLKYVNDTFGHVQGDAYITTVADMLVRFSPQSEVSRLGGDEFMVLAPGFTREEAKTRMEQIAGEIAASAQEYSISYGVVEVDGQNDLSSGRLLELADERMYAHKRKQRAERQKEN